MFWPDWKKDPTGGLWHSHAPYRLPHNGREDRDHNSAGEQVWHNHHHANLPSSKQGVAPNTNKGSFFEWLKTDSETPRDQPLQWGWVSQPKSIFKSSLIPTCCIFALTITATKEGKVGIRLPLKSGPGPLRKGGGIINGPNWTRSNKLFYKSCFLSKCFSIILDP